MSQYKGKIIIFVLLMLLCRAIYADEEFSAYFSLNLYGQTEGMSNELTKSIARDSLGYIWIGTDEGLIRYNGKTFELFMEGLPSPAIKDLLLLSDGRLIGTCDLGMFLINYSLSKPQITTLLKGCTSPTDSLFWYPKELFEDTKGVLWISDNHSVWSMDGDVFIQNRFAADDLSNNVQHSFEVSEDKTGRLYVFSPKSRIYYRASGSLRFDTLHWQHNNNNLHMGFAGFADNKLFISNDQGVFVLQPDRLQNKLPLIDEIKTLRDISCAEALSDTTYLLGSWSDGLHMLEVDSYGRITTQKSESITQNNINDMLLSTGSLWLSSDNGILYAENQYFNPIFHELTHRYIQDVTMDELGQVFFTDGDKLYTVNHAQEAIEIKFSHQNTLLQITAQDKNIYITDNTGILYQTDYSGNLIQKTDLSSSGSAIFMSMMDSRGTIWLCQDGYSGLICISAEGSVKYYGTEDGISSRIVCVNENADGSIYAGGLLDSAYLFKKEANKKDFKNISLSIPFDHNTDLNINEIIFDKDQNIWLASSFGLLQYQKDSLHRTSLGDNTSNSIKSLAMDKNGHLWLAVSEGLIRFYKNNYLLFNEDNGLPSKTIGYRDILVDQKNQLWIGTVEGLAFATNDQEPLLSPSPIITRLQINGQEAQISNGSIKISTSEFLRINYFCPIYPGSLVHYEYRIINSKTQDQKQWKEAEDEIDIYPDELPTGINTLQIRSQKSGNYLWSNICTLDMELVYPWYLQFYNILFIILALGLMIYAVIYLNSIRLKNDKAKLEQIIARSTQTLRQQKEELEIHKNQIALNNEVLKKNNQELMIAKQKAEEAARAKSNFLSTMSHELRTPMNAVIGLAYILLQDNPKPNQIENLKTLKFSGENLLALINDILDFSKIEADKIHLEQADFSLKDLFVNLRNVFQFKIDEKSIKFETYIDEAIPLYLVGDPTRLNQILSNLLSNAVKFTEKGSIKLSVKQLSEDEKQVDILFCVSDTGIGIPKDQQQEIFNSFTQASSETTRKYGGTGLGLSITKKLLELHNSHIELESTVGEGSRFFFKLSFQKSNKTTLQEQQPESLEFIRFNGEDILLVDDNQVNLFVAKKFLKNWGLNVHTASNGQEALEKVQTKIFRLILMDLQMPVMSGYESSAAIRKMGNTVYQKVPIIALTASALLEVQEKVQAAGMNDYITKPFNPLVLNHKIAKYLNI